MSNLPFLAFYEVQSGAKANCDGFEISLQQKFMVTFSCQLLSASTYQLFEQFYFFFRLFPTGYSEGSFQLSL